MVRVLVAASTAAVAAVLLTAGCGLGPAVPSPAAAEATPPPPRKLMEVVRDQPRLTEPPLYQMREPTARDRKGALLILLFGARR